ncbi:cuticle protein 19.8-like [Penaeus japonicus]|uniref:cuticle protein 19.8-like n=1 Tax=Penaeus japonicus TaxID=27405 RepID=UPI001C70DA9E|nr:cuticle protein 19.8-like [Penaeus japonicus]
MNALTVLSLAAVAASGCASLLGHAGIYGGYGLHGGLSGAYGHLPHVARVAPVTYNAPYAPLAYNVAPYAPVAPIQSQYHAQDEIGQYSFGYAGGPSSRSESRDAYGVVRGSYNYVDSEGKVQTQHYVADALGFRVSGTNLPVAPDAPVAAPLALPGPLPEPVQDTPEVAAAKAAHQQAYDEAAAAAAAAPDHEYRRKRSVLAAPGLGVYAPLRFSYGFSAPLHYGHHAVYGAPLHHAAAHPAVYNAELLRVVNNPGHAVSYRVH